MSWFVLCLITMVVAMSWVLKYTQDALNEAAIALDRTADELKATQSQLRAYQHREAREADICAKLREASARMNSAAQQLQDAHVDWVAKRLARIEGVDEGTTRQRVATAMQGPHVKIALRGKWIPLATGAPQQIRQN